MASKKLFQNSQLISQSFLGHTPSHSARVRKAIATLDTTTQACALGRNAQYRSVKFNSLPIKMQFCGDWSVAYSLLEYAKDQSEVCGVTSLAILKSPERTKPVDSEVILFLII